ncbi:MAG TPA: DUF6491 family protein [Steroidobacteraceae bacterium]|nr:DUF6491 family protein [Steroidobacteraceae bacterium]
MRHELWALAPAAALLALFGACASSPPPTANGAAPATTAQQQALARYRAYAGPPIDRFTWLGHFYSWEQLSRDQLVVFTTPSDAYLLKVWSSCDLRFVINTIGVTTTGGTVSAHLDSVTIDSAPTGRMVCPIDEIRSIDYRRMTADLRAKAQQSGAAPPAPAAQQNPATPPH